MLTQLRCKHSKATDAMDRERFEELVIEALSELPEDFQDKLENIDVVVADQPSSRWVINEMMLRIGGQKVWLWDVIESESRFLLATNLGQTRTMRSAIAILSEANKRTIGVPKEIVSDGIRACPGTVERVFGTDSTHIRAKGITTEIDINIIERFQGTVEERTRIMNGLKTIESAKIISEGFIVHYNFLRSHIALGGRTSASVAGLELPFKTWEELVDYLWRIS